MLLFSQAFAEETAAAAAGSASKTPVFAFACILVGAYEIISGLMTVLKKKLYGSNAQSYERYTDESVVKATPYLGFSNMICGLFLVMVGLKDAGVFKIPDTAEWIALGLVFTVAVALVIYTYRKVLIKKDQTGNRD